MSLAFEPFSQQPRLRTLRDRLLRIEVPRDPRQVAHPSWRCCCSSSAARSESFTRGRRSPPCHILRTPAITSSVTRSHKDVDLPTLDRHFRE